jgi:hypothetical protein
MRTIPTLLIVALFCSALFADEHSIVFDEHTEFSKLRTFAIRETKSDSAQHEIDNPLYLKTIADTIRTALSAKGCCPRGPCRYR